MDTSGLWGSLAFASNLEISRNMLQYVENYFLCGVNVLLCDVCTDMSMSINIFKEMGERKFRMACMPSIE